MLAVQLVRRAGNVIGVALIERNPQPGPGLAYGTQFEGNLLNVRAENMSAYPDVPNHFVKWAQRHCHGSVKSSDFLPRSLYGQYIVSQLREATRFYPDKLRCTYDDAISLAPSAGATMVHLASGHVLFADKVVLALGNFPPADLSLPGKKPNSSRYFSNPWSASTFIDVNYDGSVLLIGSGLTSVDVSMELRARGFKGRIHILSRRGLLPRSHKATVPFPSFWSNNSPCTVRGLLQLIRLQIKIAEARGSDWRSVIDALRPFTQEVWRTLPRVEQRRFLRHLRPYWDVHRHRIADQVADQITLQLRTGQIRVLAGRITEYCEDTRGVQVSYRDRNSGKKVVLHVDRVVNCTGPESDYRRCRSPLLSDLLDKKLARPDELSLGLDVSDDGALLDAWGTPSHCLYALGPMRKGNLWETVAVPEIRSQVSKLADLLVSVDKSKNPAATAAVTTTEISTSL
jgi:uncharacterized NAD(P)/FAD-binding protein YdhS